jgi:hypothetical protein
MLPINLGLGSDSFTFRVDSSAGSSNTATVTIRHTTCAGDTDGNNVIDLSDLGVVLANYGLTTGGTLATGDVDGDGAVDLSDLGVVLSNYGTECP